MRVRISEIVADPTIQIRRQNHEQTIRRYEESFDKLPPVIIYRTPEGDLLADGFHRLTAADRLGLDEIEAEIRTGTRADAAEYAVVANTQNGDPLSQDERDEGIRRLKQLHPDWTNRQIADAVSVSSKTIDRVFAADEVRRAVFAPTERLTNRHYAEVSTAPKEHWEPLVKAAEERGWSRDATALAVRNIKDDRIPAERKQEILNGDADPVVVTPEGQFAVPAEIVSRQIRDMAANDAVLALERALEQLAKLRLYSPEAIVNTAGGPRLDRLIAETPGYIEFLQQLLSVAQRDRGKVSVLK